MLRRAEGREVRQECPRPNGRGRILHTGKGRTPPARVETPLRRDRIRLMKSLQRFWHRNSPQLFLGELLEKRWMEPIVPFTLTIVVFLVFAAIIPRYLTPGSLQQLMRNFAEQGMVAIAMAFSVLSGGIDLSVGSVFAMANFLALYFYLILGLPLPLMIVLVIVFGALMGAINGGMIAYGRDRKSVV